MRLIRGYNLLEFKKKRAEYFQFLIDDYKYELFENKEETLAFSALYIKDDIRIDLLSEFLDPFFYYAFIKGKNTIYPNDAEDKNILPFYRLFKYYDKNLDVRKLQPDDDQYEEALKLNAELLKKYGDKILKGVIWFHLDKDGEEVKNFTKD